jgi:hypothetical protein
MTHVNIMLDMIHNRLEDMVLSRQVAPSRTLTI